VSSAGAGWLGILDRWGVTMIVTSRDGDPRLGAALSENAGWREVHDDADGLVFVRSSRPD
jgi:hypothetical protein